MKTRFRVSALALLQAPSRCIYKFDYLTYNSLILTLPGYKELEFRLCSTV
jgi:hypothetical protein